MKEEEEDYYYLTPAEGINRAPVKIHTPPTVGEICVSGVVVTRSYVKQEDNANNKDALENGTIIHRTGDMGCATRPLIV